MLYPRTLKPNTELSSSLTNQPDLMLLKCVHAFIFYLDIKYLRVIYLLYVTMIYK